jgi:hypothetical protein
MQWATRAGCHIDRAACAWLIRRFVDPEAVFLFVSDPDDVPDGVIAFDMRGAALSHHGGACTFEAILTHFGITDPSLWDIARIVHEADLADERYDAPEAAGLDVLVRGLSMLHDDAALLTITATLFDGLYAYRERTNLLTTSIE